METRHEETTATNQETLRRYQRALPADEFAALEAWCTTFYPFQLDWLLEQADQAICNKSRQIGFSHTTSGWGVLRGVFHGETTTIISEGEREAKEVLLKAKAHARVIEKLGSKMARKRRDSAEMIEFASGGRVIALPQSAGRGFTGNVFLDEFAYLQRARAVWDAAAAVTMLPGLKLRVCSTPNGVGNDFYELWHEIDRNEKLGAWKRHQVDIDDAIAQGYPVDIDKCWGLAKGDPRLFSQLFRCQFLDGELQYIPTSLVEPCLVDRIDGFESGDYYAGLDVGKEADRTVLVVVCAPDDEDPSQRAVVYIETRPRTNSEELDAMVDRAFDVFGLRKLCVDSTGLGSFPAERMQTRHGVGAVEPINFTLKSKEGLATGLYSAFSERSLILPRTDTGFPPLPSQSLPGNGGGLAQQLRLDISSLQRIITTAGNVRYDAPRTVKGHADSAWALALALHAYGYGPMGDASVTRIASARR